MRKTNRNNTLVLHRVITDKNGSFEDVTLPILNSLILGCDDRLATIEEAFMRKSDKDICLTFDDGSDSDHSLVLPELKRRGGVATFFIVTDWIGRQGKLTKDQIINLSQEGMQIGSHSASHPNFLELDQESQIKELSKSKNILEGLISKEVTTFAFPYGFFDKRAIDSVFKSGYKFCCTSDHGLSLKNNNVIKRNSINLHTPLDQIPNLLDPTLSMRIYWLMEDKFKRLIKKYLPNLYPAIRDSFIKLLR